MAQVFSICSIDAGFWGGEVGGPSLPYPSMTLLVLTLWVFKPDLGDLSAASPQGQGAWHETWSFTPPGCVAQFWVPPSRGPSTWRGSWARLGLSLSSTGGSSCVSLWKCLSCSDFLADRNLPHRHTNRAPGRSEFSLPAPPPQTYSYDLRSHLGNFTPNL